MTSKAQKNAQLTPTGRNVPSCELVYSILWRFGISKVNEQVWPLYDMTKANTIGNRKEGDYYCLSNSD